MRRHTLIAAGLVGLGLLCLVAAFATSTSAREYVADTYEPAGERRVEGAGRSLLYNSSDGVTRTAADIADAVKPGDRRVTPAGVFLRYEKDIVSVVPRGAGDAQVIVEDERTGYRSGFLFLGGFWGTSSRRGAGAGVRGGGPGSGGK